MNIERTSCHATDISIVQLSTDGESGNTSRPASVGDKSVGGYFIGGHMKWDARLGAEEAGGWILSSLARKPKTNTRSILKWVLWIAILMIMVITLASGCAREAWAMDLTASWYSEAALKRDGQWDITHGRMANGQLFTDSGLTAASWDFPLGTTVKVTRTDTKASVVVLVADRTARRFKAKRIDLSKGAFSRIADCKQGIIPVTVEAL